MSALNSPIRHRQEDESRFQRSVKIIEAVWAIALILSAIAGAAWGLGAAVNQYDSRVDKLEWDMSAHQKTEEKIMAKLDDLGQESAQSRRDLSEMKGYMKRLTEKGM